MTVLPYFSQTSTMHVIIYSILLLVYIEFARNALSSCLFLLKSET